MTCALCREKVRRAMADYRKRRILSGRQQVAAFGVQRRIRALAVVGYSQKRVGARVGVCGQGVHQWMTRETVQRSTVEKVGRVYRELAFSGQLGPDDRERRAAMRRGWPGPWDWEDIDDPRADPVPGYVLEQAHTEALKVHREYRKMLAKRERRARMSDRERQAAQDAQRQRRARSGVA